MKMNNKYSVTARVMATLLLILAVSSASNGTAGDAVENAIPGDIASRIAHAQKEKLTPDQKIRKAVAQAHKSVLERKRKQRKAEKARKAAEAAERKRKLRKSINADKRRATTRKQEASETRHRLKGMKEAKRKVAQTRNKYEREKNKRSQGRRRSRAYHDQTTPKKLQRLEQMKKRKEEEKKEAEELRNNTPATDLNALLQVRWRRCLNSAEERLSTTHKRPSMFFNYAGKRLYIPVCDIDDRNDMGFVRTTEELELIRAEARRDMELYVDGLKGKNREIAEEFLKKKSKFPSRRAAAEFRNGWEDKLKQKAIAEAQEEERLNQRVEIAEANLAAYWEELGKELKRQELERRRRSR